MIHGPGYVCQDACPPHQCLLFPIVTSAPVVASRITEDNPQGHRSSLRGLGGLTLRFRYRFDFLAIREASEALRC
jgi:hypothetical protein